MKAGARWVTAGLAALALLLAAGSSVSQAATFSNPSRLVILDNTNASPYPSEVVLKGVAGRITSVTASLLGFSHSYVSDVEVLLAGPSGQTVLLMAHVGDLSSASNVDLTFDDSGPKLPPIGAVVSGTYRPTQFGSTPFFPPPAPAPPYGVDLSVFTNQTPNGVWSLFVHDDSPGDSGVLSGGWSITVAIEGKSPAIAALSSMTAEEGSAACLPVRTSGDWPLGYQWYFNGTNAIPGGTGSCLQFANVQPTNAGPYSVVVTNTFGAVTSAPVMLSVIPPVERSMYLGLLLTAESGTVLFLEYADALTAAPDWRFLGHLRMDGMQFISSQWYFDGLAPSTGQRFYRLRNYDYGSFVGPLELHLVPGLRLTGPVGRWVPIDYINQSGPTDAWVPLEAVQLTNTSQVYFDTSAVGQPPRLYRLSGGLWNLDFEQATGIPATPGYPANASFSEAFPGWTGYCGATQQTVVQYDYPWLDTAGISIMDSKCTTEPVASVLHGRYCVCLYSGFQGPPPDFSYDVPTWITQTGQVPKSAKSILLNYSQPPDWGYYGGTLQMTMNGTGIDLRVLSPEGVVPIVMGADVSQFAGQVVELQIGVFSWAPHHSRGLFLIDYIRFSSSPLTGPATKGSPTNLEAPGPGRPLKSPDLEKGPLGKESLWRSDSHVPRQTRSRDSS